MSIHLARDLANLERDILTLCGQVAEAVHQGIAVLEQPDPSKTAALIAQEDAIDRLDVQIEETCLKMLALHQPVAVDLRRIATALRITTELERVADLGVNIAERGAALAALPPVPLPEKLHLMAQRAVDMLDRSIASYIKLDVPAARIVCAEDDDIDRLNREIIDELTDLMRRDPRLIEPAMHLFSACRNVERVADHATNIAEDVIYLAEGEIVRHHPELIRPAGL